jgi:hypothetical protein
MKHRVATCLLALSLAAPFPGPASAQDEGTPDEGLSLMERGAQMFLEGILREMEPAMRDLRDLAEDMGPELRRFMQEMGPAFAELLGQIDDLSAYHPPEMLPNGDIILRRKRPDETEPELAPPKEGEIDI